MSVSEEYRQAHDIGFSEPLPNLIFRALIISSKMPEVVFPLLDLSALAKTPSGKLPSKADFLCLLWGSVGGNFVGFRGKIYFD